MKGERDLGVEVSLTREQVFTTFRGFLVLLLSRWFLPVALEAADGPGVRQRTSLILLGERNFRFQTKRSWRFGRVGRIIGAEGGWRLARRERVFYIFGRSGIQQRCMSGQ
jgi:hypothetical protein